MAAPTGTQTPDLATSEPPRATAHGGRQWISWVLVALAIVADVAQVIGAATTRPSTVIGIAAGLAMLAGATGLWLLAARRNLVFALSLISVVVSSGVAGFLLARAGSDGAHGTAAPLHPPSTATSPTGAATPQPAPSASTSPDGPAPSKPLSTTAPPTGPATPRPPDTATPFTGDATITNPRFGNTMSSGDDVSGTVTGRPDGFQLWLFVRGEHGERSAPQGPCTVTGTSWTCAKVTLVGVAGRDRDIIDLVVAPDSTAKTFPGNAAAAIAPPATSAAQVTVYKI
jgi:hypothetical protein